MLLDLSDGVAAAELPSVFGNDELPSVSYGQYYPFLQHTLQC